MKFGDDPLVIAFSRVPVFGHMVTAFVSPIDQFCVRKFFPVILLSQNQLRALFSVLEASGSRYSRMDQGIQEWTK